MPSPVRPVALLDGVAAVSASNAWAFGSAITGGGFGSKTVILHWNGRTWKRVPSPSPSQSALFSVAALSSRSAWAVGVTFSATSQGQALIERWNGKSWKRVHSPAPGAGLHSVSATSARNAWAAGFGGTGGGYLILRWNGAAWKVVPSPKFRGYLPYPAAVAATSASNAWVVGSTSASNVLIERWNGKGWQRGPEPGGSLSVCGRHVRAERLGGRQHQQRQDTDPALERQHLEVTSRRLAQAPTGAWLRPACMQTHSDHCANRVLGAERTPDRARALGPVGRCGRIVAVGCAG